MRSIVANPDIVDLEHMVEPRLGLTRRRFVQAAVASAAAGLVVPAWMRDAAGAAPLGPDDGVLVVVTLRGGCDPLSVLVPRDGAQRSAYEVARGNVAVPAASLLPASDDYGLNPKLPRIADRYAAGNVAIVQGVGLAQWSRSHFVATARMHSSHENEPATGWAGRHIDELAASTSGVAAVTLSPTVPLHLVGHRDGAVALPLRATLWGADTSKSYERSAFDAVRSFAAEPTGLGEWGDAMAQAAMMAVDEAATLGPITNVVAPSTKDLTRALETGAHAINANVGLRVIAAEIGGFDTHANQTQNLNGLLSQLDAAIDRFFAVLDPARGPQVSVLIQSEFGRRVAANSSAGTDHGNAGFSMLIGDNVNGGLHGEHPSLVDLDANGNLIPNVDHREIYATVLEQWLAGDANAVLGRTFDHLDIFTASPGSAA